MADGRVHELVGKRFHADLRVASVAEDEDRTVTVYMHGDTYRLALEELMTMIDRGFLVEIPS